MSDGTTIEWTRPPGTVKGATWNPVTGCTEVSPGCDHCYAKTFAERFRGVEGHPYEQGFDLKLWPERLHIPLQWKKPRGVFVNSMSDLFQDGVPEEFVAQVWRTMLITPRHTYQVLTKRPGRMASVLAEGGLVHELLVATAPIDVPWPLPNVWLGTSVEDQRWADIRVPKLLETPAAVRFLSAEPLLGPINLDGFLWENGRREAFIGDDPRLGPLVFDESRLHWVIVGGESGPGARPMQPDWARSLRDRCVDAGVAFLFKQWGAWAPMNQTVGLSGAISPNGGEGRDMRRVGKKRAGRELDGRTWDEYPKAVLS